MQVKKPHQRGRENPEIRRENRVCVGKWVLLCFIMTWLIPPSAVAASIRLAWDPTPDYFLTGYHVYRADVFDGPYERLTADPVSGPEFLDETADLGHQYFYAITAVDSEGKESAFSSKLSVCLTKYDAFPEPGALVARSGPDLSARMQDVVILRGTHRDPSGQSVSHHWTQISGPPVALSGSDSSVATFLAPLVSSDTIFAFCLTITDPSGGNTTDFISVTVRRQ